MTSVLNFGASGADPIGIVIPPPPPNSVLFAVRPVVLPVIPRIPAHRRRFKCPASCKDLKSGVTGTMKRTILGIACISADPVAHHCGP